ncbi:MAG: glycosyltransferase [Bdellovibrionales bacterium]|nr:glycosyltransferase [Bdellovibrionales bacterium]
MLFTILVWVVFGVSLISAILVFRGNRRVQILKHIEAISPNELPSLSVVMAARNEEKKIEESVRSLLSVDYPNFKIIAVNDRSDDRTKVILESLKIEDSRLEVIHIKDLPKGWLGKNHALFKGARQSTGKYILFTDADIIFEQDALKRALSFVVQEDLDHLAVIPELLGVRGMLAPMISYFTFCFAAHFQPWKMREPNSSKFAGIGAFNLVKKETYDRLGGHQKLMLRPDDDLMLGKLFKLSKTKQDILFGQDQVKVLWYETFWEFFKGLEKNAFAGADYQVTKLLALTVLTLLFHVFPFVYLFVCIDLHTWMVSFLSSGSLIFVNLDNNRFHRMPSWTAFVFPISAILMLVTMYNATIKTLWNRGISWRGTFYSLNELKRNRL